MTKQIAKGPCYIVENPHGYGGATIRRVFSTMAEVLAYETDKLNGIRSWNVPEGETEEYLEVEEAR